MYDFTELRAYAEAHADAMDKHENYERVVAQRKLDEGWIIVSHTGGGNQPENRLYDYFTGETLAVVEDTLEAMDRAWQDNWYHADRLTEDAYDLYQGPTPKGFFTGTGGMPKGMFDAIVQWIEQDADAKQLREFANDI